MKIWEAMIKNYLITNLRSLWKNRSHAIINMLGLSMGITCSILIFLILRFELSFDNFHVEKERVYRVVTEFTKSEKPGYTSGMTYPLPPALRNDFADLEYVTIVDANLSNPVIRIDRNGEKIKFKESGVAFVDPDYFNIFSYEWIDGNKDALKKEKTVVLTESLAKKYFGDEDAMNKVFNFNNEFDVTVAGVVKDPPVNSDFPFQMILSANLGADKRGWESWGSTSSSINGYVKLNSSTSKAAFEKKLKGWHLKYFTGNDAEDGKYRNYFLQPLNEIHFDSRFGNFGHRTVSYATLLTLAAIGILLLGTACINFVNLNTVLIINRSKEAGIRKVMGSTKQQLVSQFLGETFVITLLSLLISTGLAELALMYLAPLLGYNLDFNPLTDYTTTVFLVALPFAVTILSGLYPAIKLSRFQPIEALKSKVSGNPAEGFTLRRGLIVFQLMISQILVVSTIIVVQQLNHFMSRPLGINSNAIVEFELPENKPEIIHRLAERLQTVDGVINVSMSNTGTTSTNQWSGDYEATVNGKIIKQDAAVKFADENYVDTYQLKLLYGENLIKSDSATRFLVTESLARSLGFENPADAIGTPLNVWGNKALVTGIVNDFYTTSLHQKIQPTVIFNGTKSYYVGAVRLKTDRLQQGVKDIQKVWEDVYPDYVFEYQFLDETISQFYQAERKNSYLIGVFAGVAIFIGSIGLFGLVSFMAKAKTKEVGIRKTLGASVTQVIGLFSKEFLMLIGISFALSAPVAYYFMDQWLNNFPYRIYPGVTTFLIGVSVTLIVVLITVGFRSYKAAVANPVDALRDE